MLLTDVYAVYGEVFPQTATALAAAISSVVPADVTGISFLASPTNLRISWSAATNAVQYEVRKGATWATATYVVTTNQLLVNIDPIVNNLTVGNHTFLVKAISSTSTYSNSAGSAVFTVPSINAPTLSGSVIQNNALLSWVDPLITWEISYYVVYRDAVEIGYIDGNFMISSEIVAGNYSYTVEAVDIVGNTSALSPATVLDVEDPIDLIFIDAVNSIYDGTFTNTFAGSYNGVSGVVGATISETYQDHFDDNSWASPQAQVTAGFPEWLSPTGTTGSYQEVFDFGSIRTNITIGVAYSKLNLFGSTTVSADIEYSDDNVTYSSPVTATSVLATSMRYARVTWDFTNSDDNSLAFIYNVVVNINTQQVLDSGTGTANSGDAGGTTINTNKTFQQINSVTLTPDSTTAVMLVYANVATDHFHVYAFDAAGVRATANFSWKVRGII